MSNFEQWCTFVPVNNKINTSEVSMALNKYYNMSYCSKEELQLIIFHNIIIGIVKRVNRLIKIKPCTRVFEKT